MTLLRNLLIILLISVGLHAQTKLIVFSEDNQSFVATLNNDVAQKDAKPLFEFSNVGNQNHILKVELNNQRLKKTIKLKENMQNVYTISNNDGYYEILFRGSYYLEDTKEENIFDKKTSSSKEVKKAGSQDSVQLITVEEVDYAQNELININYIIDELSQKENEKSKSLYIVDELNKGKFNCRQLKYLFSKIDTDYSKLYTFKSTIHRCVDKENLIILMQSFETQKYQDNFKELISYL